MFSCKKGFDICFKFFFNMLALTSLLFKTSCSEDPYILLYVDASHYLFSFYSYFPLHIHVLKTSPTPLDLTGAKYFISDLCHIG